MRRITLVVLCLLIGVVSNLPASAQGRPPRTIRVQGPDLGVDPGLLADSLRCSGPLQAGPRAPILLVHGTFVLPEENWGWGYAKALPERGYLTCTVRLPDRALGDIQVASEYVVYAIRHIAHATDSRVDVLGHSQGGLESRWAAKWWPDIELLTDDIVSLGSPHHGTDTGLGCDDSPFGCQPALWQQSVGSDFLAALNADDETPGDIDYTSVYTDFDLVVRPPRTAVLDGASNVRLQDLCPFRPTDHGGLAGDAATFAVVMDAFEGDGPADLDRVDDGVCSQVAFDGVDPITTAPAILSESVSSDLSPFFEATDSEPPLAPYAKAG